MKSWRKVKFSKIASVPCSTPQTLSENLAKRSIFRRFPVLCVQYKVSLPPQCLCKSLWAEGSPRVESRLWDQPRDNSQEGGLREKGLCQPSPSLQTVLSPPPPLPSPSLLLCYPPLLSYPTLCLSVCLYLSFSCYFFSSSSFLDAFLEFKFIYKLTSFQVEQSRKVAFR